MAAVEWDIDAAPADRSPVWGRITFVAMAALGAATLVALMVILSGANRQRDRALLLQSHSYDVMILARTLSATIAQSEASLGRYVISGDLQLGRLYSEDWALAGNQIDRLDRITSDNREQQRRVDALRAAYIERGRDLGLVALSTTYAKNSQAYARYFRAGKAPVLARINRLLDTIIARQRVLLATRSRAVMGTVERSNRIAGVLAVFGTLLVLSAIVLGWLTLAADTERKVAQAEAEAARQRAAELGEAVAQATDELRVQEAKLRQVQKMEAVGQLTGGIAHDFNNMLAVVLGGLELARRALSGDPGAAIRHIDSATEGANRAAALTRRLLAFSREDALTSETLVAGEIVGGMSDLLDRTLGDAITLVAHDGSAGWRIRADRVQIENAILNLAVNARDAMHGRGMLTIATGRTTLDDGQIGGCSAGEHVTISVTDTGTGMDAAVLERVFEPFFTTKPVGKGTGLGLSQIFASVRQLGGGVAIDSTPGQGTTVTLYLPRDTSAPVAAQAAPAAVAAAPRGPLTILVVEDDPRVLAATMGALAELGHDAVSCDDPLAVPTLLEQHPGVDLIVSDVLMPRQTGPEMVEALIQRFPHLAVLFVTGFAGEANAQAFGDHVLLRKPFTLAALERAIDAALARRRSAAPDRIAAE
jgi:signal transduction histidine kinase/ActR/RegA family two-component response regulator